MARGTSHSVQTQSTVSQVPTEAARRAVGRELDARWNLNRRRVAALRALADDLEKHPAGDATDTACIVAVVEAVLHGADAELDATELRYLAAIGVPPELVRGSGR